MRRITLDENFYYKRVTYILVSRDKKGSVIKVIMENSTSQFYYPGNWRRFKKYIQ